MRINGIDCVAEPDRASRLLHPIRMAILRHAIEPISASELAPRLGLPRQRVNYHVRQLARGGFLRKAGRRRRRNMIEQRYVASAQGLLLSPELLGSIGADWRRVEDVASAGYLLALCCQMQSDLIRGCRQPQRPDEHPSTLSLKSQFRLETREQRERFLHALRDAVIGVIARHTSPDLRPEASASAGRAYRLVLGCYAYAPEEAAGRPGAP